MRRRKGFFARVADLFRGFFGVRLRDAEARNAEVVYHNAITRRERQADGLKDAVARLVYLRNRVEAELQRRRADLRLVEESLVRAARADDDARALDLLRKKRKLEEEVARLAGEHARLTEQTTRSKEGLAAVRKSVAQLKRERDEMIARQAHAEARLEVAEALQASNGDLASTDQALESVRESILHLEQQADLDPGEEPGGDGEVSLAQLRREAAEQADREVLAALKATLNERLLPEGEAVKVPAPAAEERQRVLVTPAPAAPPVRTAEVVS